VGRTPSPIHSSYLTSDELHKIDLFLNHPSETGEPFTSWANEFPGKLKTAAKHLRVVQRLITALVDAGINENGRVTLSELPERVPDNKDLTGRINAVLRFTPIRAYIKFDQENKRNDLPSKYHFTLERLDDLSPYVSQPRTRTAGPQLITRPATHVDKLAARIRHAGIRCEAVLIHHSLVRARPLLDALIRTGSSAQLYVSDPDADWQSTEMQKRTRNNLQVTLPTLVDEISHEAQHSMASTSKPEIFNAANLNFIYYPSPASLRATLIRYPEMPDQSFLCVGHYITDGKNRTVSFGHDDQGYVFDVFLEGTDPNFEPMAKFIELAAHSMTGGETQPVLRLSNGSLDWVDAPALHG